MTRMNTLTLYSLALVPALTPVLISSPVQAGELLASPKQVLHHCQGEDDVDQSFCRGYIMAVADTRSVCIPPSIHFNTVQDLAVSSLQASDADYAQAPADIIRTRLESVFPCAPTASKTGDADSEPERGPNKRSPNWSNKTRYGK